MVGLRIDIHVFRGGPFGGPKTHVCVARREPIMVEVISVAEIETTFLGHVVYRDESGVDLAGVWGARRCSKFRRLLRERGADLVVHREPPPAWLRHWRTQDARRPRARRPLT